MFDRNKPHTIWAEKYRPATLEEYVGNDAVKQKVKIYLDSGDIPHLLLYGSAGGGKTSLAKLIVNQIGCDYLYINASDENSIDTIREKVKAFASTVSFGNIKVIILDESDYLSINAMAAMRAVLETFSKSTRFILTCNYVEKIIDPIQSRCQLFNIVPPSMKDVAIRSADILNKEGIEFSMEDLATIIKSCYPDIRRVLNTMQRQCVNGKLVIDKQSIIESNYMLKLVDIIKAETNKKQAFTKIRQLLADSQVRDFTPLYKYLYDEIETYAHEHIGSCILIIAESEYNDSFVVNKDINVMAMILKILNQIK